MRAPDRTYTPARKNAEMAIPGLGIPGETSLCFHIDQTAGVPPTGETFLEGTGMMSARRSLPPACGSALQGGGAGPLVKVYLQ